MQKLNLDLGLREYEIGGGVLRFNPSDPNVYARFVEMSGKLTEIEQKLVQKAKSSPKENAGETMLMLLKDADSEMKGLLREVFGAHNDFDAIFCGANIAGVGANGERIITNFIHAIQPILEAGAKRCAKQQVNQAKLNREQRRALAKKK